MLQSYSYCLGGQSNVTEFVKGGTVVNATASFHAYECCVQPFIQHSAELWKIMRHFPTMPATQDALVELS